MVSRRATMVLMVPLVLGAGCGWWKLETRGADDGATAAASDEQTSSPSEAPAFSLANDDGTHVSLDGLLAGGKPAILVFYRGHW